MCSYLLTNYLLFAMDNLLDIVSTQSSLNKVDAKKLGVFASNVPIWDYIKITKSEYKKFIKEVKSNLLLRYCSSICERFKNEIFSFLYLGGLDICNLKS